jgi:hypothetical protein
VKPLVKHFIIGITDDDKKEMCESEKMVIQRTELWKTNKLEQSLPRGVWGHCPQRILLKNESK